MHNSLLILCPKLHTREELVSLAEKFVNDFINTFNHQAFRIWFNCTAPMLFSDISLESKYFESLKIYENYVYQWLTNHKLTLRLDVFLFGKEVKKHYNGFSFDAENEFTMQLWGIIKTIRETLYDEKIINALEDEIKTLILKCGNKYYTKKDIKDKNILKELYFELCEVLHTEDGFSGDRMFYSYDGYGNVYFTPTGELEMIIEDVIL